MTKPVLGVCLLHVHSWPSLSSEAVLNYLGMIMQGWTDLCEFGPTAGLPCKVLGPSGPPWVLKASSSISRSSSIAWRDCTVSPKHLSRRSMSEVSIRNILGY